MALEGESKAAELVAALEGHKNDLENETTKKSKPTAQSDDAKAKPKLLGTLKPEPEIKTSIESTQGDNQSASEKAKPETIQEPEVTEPNKSSVETSAEVTSSSSKPEVRSQIISETNQSVEQPPKQDPEVGKTTSGRDKERRIHRSITSESDTEISDILRNAPPPSVLPEDDEDTEGPEGEGQDEGQQGQTGSIVPAAEDIEREEGETGATIIIMKKTFTESINPGKEFIPIQDDSSATPSSSSTAIPGSASPPHRLQRPIPSTTTTTTTTGNERQESNTDNRVVTAPGFAENIPEVSVLSKAQSEARDLTSEIRRLQYLLENLSSFTELEIASFQPEEEATAAAVETVAKRDEEVEKASPSVDANRN